VIAAALAALAAAGRIRLEPINEDLPPGTNQTTDPQGNVTSYRDPDGNVVVDPRLAMHAVQAAKIAASAMSQAIAIEDTAFDDAEAPARPGWVSLTAATARRRRVPRAS
jgi:hypothetical protein